MGLLINIFLNFMFFVSMVIFFILLLPFKYVSSLDITEKDLKGHLKVSWAFGFLGILLCFENKKEIYLLLFNIKIFSKYMDQVKLGSKIEKNTKTKKNIKNKKIKKKKIKKFEKELIPILINYLLKILNLIRPKYFKISGLYGFSDPSTTGKLSAILWLLQTKYLYEKKHFFDLNPIFHDELIDLNISFKGNFSLFKIIFYTILLFFKKTIRKIIF